MRDGQKQAICAPYSRKRPIGSFTRVVIEIPNNELKKVDAWGGEAKLPSRTATIRTLLQAGILHLTIMKKASGQSPNLPDAFKPHSEGNHCDDAE